MSVEGYTHGLVYFEAWYYVPGGYGFYICGEYVDLCAIYGHFLEVPEAVVTIYLPCPLFGLSNTLSLVPFICTLKILPAWFMTRQS